MKHTLDTLYCADCGSTNTSSLAWVHNEDNSLDIFAGHRLNEEHNFCNCCQAHVRLMLLTELWDKFSEVPVNNDDEIEEDFLCFPAGTDKMDVWHWFDERCPNGLVVDLMKENTK